MSIRTNGILAVAASTLLLTASSAALANKFSCVVEIAKSDCWQNRNISLAFAMNDAVTLKVINSYKMDAKTNLLQATFACDTASSIGFTAVMTPPVWPQDKGKLFHTQSVYVIPTALQKGADKWILQLCFSKDFSSVPFPVNGKVSNCKCQFPQNQRLIPVKN